VKDTPTPFDKDDLADDASQIPTSADVSWRESENSGGPDRARKLAWTIDILSLAPMVWAMFSRDSNPILILLLLITPLVAIGFVVRSKGVYQISGFRGDDRPGLSTCFVGSGVGLFCRAMLDIHIYPSFWLTIIGGALFVGGFLTFLVVRADAKTREGSWALILVVAWAFAYGAIAETNVLLDWSTPRTSEVLVFSKHASSHGRGGTSWSLHVDKWGPFVAANDISVSGSFYQCVSAGQNVCIKVYGGALRIPWYDVAVCK
jgi:hypothetical protein